MGGFTTVNTNSSPPSSRLAFARHPLVTSILDQPSSAESHSSATRNGPWPRDGTNGIAIEASPARQLLSRSPRPASPTNDRASRIARLSWELSTRPRGSNHDSPESAVTRGLAEATEWHRTTQPHPSPERSNRHRR